MSCLFSTPEQPPRQERHDPRLQMTPDAAVMAASLGSDINWLASSPNGYADGSGNEDDPILISPFPDVFPKREMFDSFDLSRIPLSLFTGAMPASLDSSAPGSAELSSAFTPESISPTTLTPASSSSSISLGNQLGFDAATFGQTADIYGSAPAIADTQTSSSSSSQPELQLPPPAMANEQSIRAPMNILSSEDRLPSSNSNTEHRHQKDSPAAMTTPPNRKLSLPQPLYQTPKHTPRKRKSTGSTPSSASSRSSSSPPPPSSGSGAGAGGCSSSPTTSILGPRKSTHNMIEKRYRTNINEKIAALRDAVPSLRLMVQRMERDGQSGFLAGGGGAAAAAAAAALLGHGEGILMDDADVSSLEAEQHLLGGLAPAHKLNKATVLSKATEYIAHLERNNAALSREVGQLRNRLTDVEVMLMHQPHPQQQQQQQMQQQQRSAAMAFGGGIW